MKRLIMTFAVQAAVFHAQAGLAVSVGSAATVDTESVTNVAFSNGGGNEINMRMQLNAQWSNNAEVIFGCDANEDGVLSADEESLLVGWDCGRWNVADCRSQTSVTLAPGSAPASRVSWRIKGDAAGVTLELDGAQTRLVTEAEFSLRACNMMKVVCRGGMSPEMRVMHPASRFGFKVVVR